MSIWVYARHGSLGVLESINGAAASIDGLIHVLSLGQVLSMLLESPKGSNGGVGPTDAKGKYGPKRRKPCIYPLERGILLEMSETN